MAADPRMERLALVVTSIAPPTAILAELARGAQRSGYHFILVGDESSPADFELPGCSFYGLARQRELDYKLARQCPTRHYARKNIGYLLALADGADVIVETDDDNIPRAEFWAARERRRRVPVVTHAGWVNAYRYFSDANIWPRGLPLTAVRAQAPALDELPSIEADCPIQQGLADENPDVDAIYRLTLPLPQSFRRDRRLALASGAWCPFNSQNTTWWRDAAPLLYLPAYCSFRMTDIWRSLVAERVAWENDWMVLFHEPTVHQQRNDHDLMRDFKDEVPGYLHNAAIAQALERLVLKRGKDSIGDNLLACYEQIVRMGLIDRKELNLLAAWLEDLAGVAKP